MKKLFLIIILIGTLSYSCSKDKTNIDPNNLLIGVWNYSTYQDNAIVYTRNLEFNDVNCYRFNADGSLVERKNSGWCGTPPISYADYDGTWTILNKCRLLGRYNDLQAGYRVPGFRYFKSYLITGIRILYDSENKP
jgi:hypothetical protein